jgi:two-component system, NarL family, sensor histidine kinase DevS
MTPVPAPAPRRSEQEQALSGPLDAYLQLSPDAVLAVDAHGRIQAANALAGELFGYDPGELAGLTVEELMPGRFQAAHAAHRAGYGRAPRHRRMGEGLDLWGSRRDGTEFPVDISLAPLPEAGSGLVVAAVRDMTQRRREQAAEAQLAAIVTSSQDAVFSMTGDGVIVSWNPGAERLLGYPAGQVTGGPASVILPGERRREFATAVKRALSGDQVERFETWCARRDGSQVETEATLSAVRDRAGPPTVAVMLRDLTERRLAEKEIAHARQHEQQLLVMDDRERIARDLHDRVIQRLFAAGMALQGTIAMAGPAAAARIDGVVGDLDAAIREIRETIFTLQHERPPARSVRAEIVALADSAAGQLGHQPALDLQGPVDTAVSDEIAGHLLAVLREALSNVARHARARATQISLQVTDHDLVLSVSDDGAGMSGTARRSGLANLRQRAEALGGSFTIGQPPGGGTGLEWRVPLRA